MLWLEATKPQMRDLILSEEADAIPKRPNMLLLMSDILPQSDALREDSGGKSLKEHPKENPPLYEKKLDLTKRDECYKEEQDYLIRLRKDEPSGVCSRLLKTKSSRLSAMLFFIIIYFLAEIIVGHITDSLTLVADSFHMLSDGIALIVGLVAVRMSKRKAHQYITTWPSKHQYYNTFGWVRFEVVGALINATFLLALCISIFMEAIEKFYDPQYVSQPFLVLAVGIGGLLINFCGLWMFGGHHHHHDSHDHQKHNHHDSHDHHKHNGHSTSNHGNNQIETLPKSIAAPKSNVALQNKDSDVESSRSKHVHEEEQMNMRAVFLHVLGDALGSVIVIISAFIFILVPHNNQMDEDAKNCSSSVNATTLMQHPNHWIVYIDPAMSVILVVIIVATTAPLFKKSSLILLQTVPKNIQLDSIKEQVEKIEGVQEIHDFHIWQLAGDKLVATVHVQCCDSETYIRVAKEMKIRLHDAGIHSLTIQPEFKKSKERSKGCTMVCETNDCRRKVCCEITIDDPKKKKESEKTPEHVEEDCDDSPINAAVIQDEKIVQDAPSSTPRPPSKTPSDDVPETIV